MKTEPRPRRLLCLTGFERVAVEKELVVGIAEQEASARKGAMQFVPRGFELGLGALVIIAIHPRILNEDVQAVNKRSRRSSARSLRCACAGDKELLEYRFAPQG